MNIKDILLADKEVRQQQIRVFFRNEGIIDALSSEPMGFEIIFRTSLIPDYLKIKREDAEQEYNTGIAYCKQFHDLKSKN